MISKHPPGMFLYYIPLEVHEDVLSELKYSELEYNKSDGLEIAKIPNGTSKLDRLLFYCFSMAMSEYQKQIGYDFIVGDESYMHTVRRPTTVVAAKQDIVDRGNFNTFTNKRRVTAVYYLNENFEGGEYSFPKFNYKKEVEAGCVFLFPSDHPYSYQMKPILKGESHLIMTWFF